MTTLAAIAAAVFAADFGMGVLVLIVAAPALARTIVVVSRRNVLGWASSEREKLVVFGQSLGMVLLFVISIAIPVFSALLGAAVCGDVLETAGEGARHAGELMGALIGLVLPGWVLWRVWNHTTAAHRAETASALNHVGASSLERGEIDLALTLFEESARLNSKLAAVHVNRAYAYRAKEEWTAAVTAIDLAILLEPGRAVFHSDRGLILLDSGSPAAALVSLNAAIRLDGNLAAAYSNRGMVHLEQGALVAAADDLEAAIRLDPECAIAFNNRGFIKAARGDHSGAIADYETAIRLDPDHPNAHKNLAWLLATAADARYRDGAKAVTHAQQALELSGGTQPQWLEILAAAFAECGDIEAAVTWQTKAIEASGEPAANEMSKRLAGYARQEPYRA